MSDEKIKAGTYYSCSHQKLSKENCNECKTEKERKAKEKEQKRDDRLLDDNPIMTNTTFLPCQGNCGKLNFVEIHGEGGEDERKYIIKGDCYRHGDTNYTCANCYEKKLSSSEISSDKSNQSISSDKPKTNYLPWILGGGLVLGIGVLAYFLTRHGNDTKNKENK